MFLEDELEYVRLKRNDNIMGWLAIIFVAALVFMFAGVMNSASATGSPSAHRTETMSAAPLQSPLAVTPTVAISEDMAATSTSDVQTLATATTEDNAGVAHASIAKLADHDIKTGALLLSVALVGGSFVMLAFGGPRGGRGGDEREDEDTINAL